MLAQAGQAFGHVARHPAATDADVAWVAGARLQRPGGVALGIQARRPDDEDVRVRCHGATFCQRVLFWGRKAQTLVSHNSPLTDDKTYIFSRTNSLTCVDVI